jgi:hypothetical protein
LGAKIGAAVVLALGAWRVVIRGWDRFDGFNGAERSRVIALGLFLAAAGLFGLSAASFFWAFGGP